MALNIDFGSGINTATGDTIYAAFVKLNSLFSTTSKDSNGDLNINGITVGKGKGSITFCSAIGYNVLSANTTGDANTAVGASSLAFNTTGSSNTAIGLGALYNNTTTSNNTAIGRDAISSNTAFSNCTGLGYATVVNASNEVQLGNSATTTYVYGTVGNRSDLRDKAEVRDTILGLDFISKLRPVDYKWDMRDDYRSKDTSDIEKIDDLKHDGTHTRSRFHHGVIAQEVEAIIKESGVDFGGFQDHKIAGGNDVLSIGYDEFIAPMIKAIQELKAEIEILKAK